MELYKFKQSQAQVSEAFTESHVEEEDDVTCQRIIPPTKPDVCLLHTRFVTQQQQQLQDSHEEQSRTTNCAQAIAHSLRYRSRHGLDFDRDADLQLQTGLV